MAVLTTIDGIPLFSSPQEAVNWANNNGLSGYHTHDYQGTIGYMGGIDHNNAVTGNIPPATNTNGLTPPQQTNITTNTGY